MCLVVLPGISFFEDVDSIEKQNQGGPMRSSVHDCTLIHTLHSILLSTGL